ncbi:MAG TPA: P-loop NTPase, partial [Chitinivibrionales bacterium]
MNDQAQRLRHFAQNLSDTFPPDDGLAARQPDVTNRCTSLAVTSGKGGVGKSTISLSLAIALAKLKKSVCVVDADIGLANIHLLLGLAPRRNLSHVVNEECLPEG